MEPISAFFIAGGFAVTCGIIGALTGYVSGYKKGLLDEPEQDDNLVHVKFEYTAHPEQFVDLFEEDFKILNDDDYLDLVIKVKIYQGWINLDKKYYDLGPIKCKKKFAIRLIKTLLLDNNSPLMVRSSYQINSSAWGILKERYGNRSSMFWVDGNSPLLFKVEGTIRSPKKEEETDEALLKAKEEVDELSRRLNLVHSRQQAKQ